MLANKVTSAQLEGLVVSRPQTIIIVGPAGAGKSFTAATLASQLLGKEDIMNHPYFFRLDAAIDGIDAVREIKDTLSRKTIGKSETRRVVVIESADRLSDSAQNALLKTIEEPPADTVIILCAADTSQLLPTIFSRAQVLRLLPLEKSDLDRHAQQQKMDAKLSQTAYFLSGGWPGLYTHLLESADHVLLVGVRRAKEIIASPLVERLATVDELAKDKQQLASVIDGIYRVMSAGFYHALELGDIPRAQKFHKARQAASTASGELRHNANAKLVATNLFMSF